jgi:late competence protein required for DNA uptake (superfamily II DNA/RNA helicase)
MQGNQPFDNTIGDVVRKAGSFSVIGRKERETMLFALRKFSEDLNTIELLFGEVTLTPSQNLRFRQYIQNNKQRVQRMIWMITGPTPKNMKVLDDKKKFKIGGKR